MTSISESSREQTIRLALDAALWGVPIVSMDAMRQAFFRDAGAGYGDVVYLSRPADWKFQITTPNASTHYVYFNFCVRHGPMVLEIPPAVGARISGSLLDAWQVPMADVGTTGEDDGRGARYLLLPPHHIGPVRKPYVPVHCSTFNGFGLLRAVPRDSSGTAVSRAVALVKQIRLYPLTRAPNPPDPRFIDMSGVLFDGIVRYDLRYFQSLARMIGEEPVRSDAAIHEVLRQLGITRHQPFAPNDDRKVLLVEAASTCHEELVSAAAGIGAPYWSDTYWTAPPGRPHEQVYIEPDFIDEERGLNVIARAGAFFLSCAPPKRPRDGLLCLHAFMDRDAKPLLGERTYRLRVPAAVPAARFWTVTVYARDTAAFIRRSPRLEVSSLDTSIAGNADGSVDVYFSPKPPAGNEHNWIATSGGVRWFAIFRLHGAQLEFFDKRWKLPDIEAV